MIQYKDRIRKSTGKFRKSTAGCGENNYSVYTRGETPPAWIRQEVI
jgi:hypothetical protein